MSPKEILLSWVSELWIYILNLPNFLHFIQYRTGNYLHLWMRIHIPNTDPYSEYGSKRIRNHNTGCDVNDRKQCNSPKYR